MTLVIKIKIYIGK